MSLIGLAARQDIRLYSNADFDELSARWVDEAGTPFALAAVALQIRDRDDNVVLEASLGNALITTASPDWWADIIIPAATIAAAEWTGVGRYDLVATRSVDGRTEMLVGGYVRISLGVTRND